MIKKLFLLILIVLAFANFAIQKAFAEIITDKEIKDAVVQKVSAELDKFDIERYEVTVVSLPFPQLILPDGDLSIKIDSIHSKSLTSRMIVRVSFLVDGKYIKSIGVPIAIKAYKNVYVAKDLIERGETITKDKVQLQPMDITSNTKDFLTEKDFEKGITALKIFQPDELINVRFTRITPDVTKNSIVKVILNSKDSIFITTDAVALGEGRVGDIINIQNKKLNKTYSAKVIGENKVLIKI